MGFLRHLQTEKLVSLNHKKRRERNSPLIAFQLGKVIP